MDSVVHGAVHQVTENETGKKHKRILPDHNIEQTKNGGGNNNTRNRGHKKPLLISWIMMVISMKGINKFLRPSAFCYPMKKKTVCEIFKKGPE